MLKAGDDGDELNLRSSVWPGAPGDSMARRASPYIRGAKRACKPVRAIWPECRTRDQWLTLSFTPSLKNSFGAMDLTGLTKYLEVSDFPSIFVRMFRESARLRETDSKQPWGGGLKTLR